jgi:hypothetical protein
MGVWLTANPRRRPAGSALSLSWWEKGRRGTDVRRRSDAPPRDPRLPPECGAEVVTADQKGAEMRFGLFGVLALGASGCASFATFQELETMDKNETQVGLGATVSGYQVDLGQESPTNIIVPAANLWVRHGITDKLEGHGRMWLPLGATLGAKYQLLGTHGEPGFGLSTGLDVGYLTIGSGDVKSTIVDTYVPLYTGYRFSPGAAFYLTPKYMLRTSFGDASGVSHMTGATGGFALGKKAKFYVEGSGIYDLSAGATSWTGGLGVGF